MVVSVPMHVFPDVLRSVLTNLSFQVSEYFLPLEVSAKENAKEKVCSNCVSDIKLP